jgi:methionyl aminopeptidase
MGFFGRERIVGKTPEQLALMRTAGLLVGRTLALLAAEVKPGMTTLDLDTLAETHIRDHGGIPNFQLVPGYRHTLCTSVNDEIVHGIPTTTRVLQEGDLLSIDCGAEVKGWNGDAAFSCIVGGRDAGRPEDLALIDDTEASLWAGIAALAVGKSLYAVGAAIEDSLTAAGEARGIEYGIVEDYVGHGIGTEMHMPPQVPNYRVSGKGPTVINGTAVAIEPMVTLGEQDNHVLADEWTVSTDDGSRAAHWEHSVAATDQGVHVLTALDGGEAKLAELGVRFAPIEGR